ncbi:MAG: hypothetical protein J6386_17365 [Candidatus Synoicihabitans palmerolidicus]|nr:hypothetical protein [Candidatus Synoicihabitans palmerolidicus]
MLEASIQNRLCPALGEFYELILKAIRAGLLIAPDHIAENVYALHWPATLNPKRWRSALLGSLIAGLGLATIFPPVLPPGFLESAVSLFIAFAVIVVSRMVAVMLLRGAGREVYARCGFLPSTIDACMLNAAQQRTVTIAPIALMALTTGVVILNASGMEFVSSPHIDRTDPPLYRWSNRQIDSRQRVENMERRRAKLPIPLES